MLSCSDGRNSLLDIASRANLSFLEVQAAARLLEANGLLEVVEPATG
jgi:aminopeptidase-like protein